MTNAKGKLTKVTSSVSTTEYTAFDILGRVTGHKQTTDGQEYATGYVYNLSGAMVEQTYPSGRVVKNVLDANGDLSMVQSKKNAAAGFWNYAQNFTYNPAGAVTSMQLGNGKWESTQFNSRLQPTQIALGSTPGATNLLKLDYEYGASGSVNNGNITKQTITVPTVGVNTGFTAVQNYSYDSLNRLKSAEETISSATSWKQTYTFDRYGNRRFDFTSGNTTFPDPNCPEAICNPTISTANNRLTSTGWQYGTAGNTTNDPQGRTFIYDAENKQIEVKNSLNATVGQYFFDGDGKRVKKVVPSTGEITVFVYDAGAKLIGEYSTIVQPVQDAKVQYLTNDHLGSPRTNTDRDGNITSRRDFHPFGEEIGTLAGGSAHRTTGLGYDADTVRKQFTGYERDDETDLDFAQARYYGNGHGRFSSPDDFLNDTRASEPASWNLYLYVRNNPLRYRDPTGKIVDARALTQEERDKILEDLRKKTGFVNLSFNEDGLLTLGDGAFDGGSNRARELLTKAIETAHFFNLIAANNSNDVAFGSYLSGVRVNHSTGERTEFSDVNIDFEDFNWQSGAPNTLDSHSIGLVLLHEFARGLFPELQDGDGVDPGQIESNWINPIRSELGLPLREQYSAREIPGTTMIGLKFTHFIQPDPMEMAMCDPRPIELVPVTRMLVWQISVGGRRR